MGCDWRHSVDDAWDRTHALARSKFDIGPGCRLTVMSGLAMTVARSRLTLLGFQITAAATVLAMAIAAMYTISLAAGTFWLSIPQMAIVHGLANAFGFRDTGGTQKSSNLKKSKRDPGSMTPERWRQVEALYDVTVRHPPEERAALAVAGKAAVMPPARGWPGSRSSGCGRNHAATCAIERAAEILRR